MSDVMNDTSNKPPYETDPLGAFLTTGRPGFRDRYMLSTSGLLLIKIASLCSSTAE